MIKLLNWTKIGQTVWTHLGYYLSIGLESKQQLRQLQTGDSKSISLFVLKSPFADYLKTIFGCLNFNIRLSVRSNAIVV